MFTSSSPAVIFYAVFLALSANAARESPYPWPVNIRTAQQTYLAAGPELNGIVFHTNALGSWERLTMEVGHGNDYFKIKTSHGQHLCAGGTANRDQRLHVCERSDRHAQFLLRTFVSIKSMKNGKWLSAAQDVANMKFSAERIEDATRFELRDWRYPSAEDDHYCFKGHEAEAEKRFNCFLTQPNIEHQVHEDVVTTEIWLYDGPIQLVDTDAPRPKHLWTWMRMPNGEDWALRDTDDGKYLIVNDDGTMDTRAEWTADSYLRISVRYAFRHNQNGRANYFTALSVPVGRGEVNATEVYVDEINAQFELLFL